MKLKTLLKNIEGRCVIFKGDYSNEASAEWIGECYSYDTAGIFPKGDNSLERSAVEAQITELYDHNVSKVYINGHGKLVIYVK